MPERRAVCLLALRADGKILSIYRNNKPLGWGLIGGKVDPGETDEFAVAREANEEAGVIVTAVQKIFQRTSRVFKDRASAHTHAHSWPPEHSPWDKDTEGLRAPCSRILDCGSGWSTEKRGCCGLEPEHEGECICEGLIEDWTVTTFQGFVTGELKSSKEGNAAWANMYDLIQGPFGEYNLALFKFLGCEICCNVCNNTNYFVCPKCKGLWK
jgi:8-oxo-dGTP pyrophosphatase MutT (NUDIX family)